MSNKKRISKRVKCIEFKPYLKRKSLLSKLLISYINSVQFLERFRSNILNAYPSSEFIPNYGELEKIIDSQGNEVEKASNEYMSLQLRLIALRKEENPDLAELKKINERLNNICAAVGTVHNQGSTYEGVISSVIDMDSSSNYINL